MLGQLKKLYPGTRRDGLTLLLLALMLWGGAAQAARLGDIATFQGVRSNPLVGYGLVVGLDNSGDQTTQTPFTTQALKNMLRQLGVTIPTGANIQLKNVAAVMVTAELPPFAAPGQKLDVTVSSVGNADSLRGGTLLMTPLKGADGKIYAVAQGDVLIPGISASAGGSSVQINFTTAGRIPDGAMVERSVPINLASEGNIKLELKRANFTTALHTMNAINMAFGANVAVALNSRVIQLDTPAAASAKVAFLARVQNIQVDPGQVEPRVVINSRTGSVVMNAHVTLDQAAVAHGSLSIVIDSNPIISQPNPLSQGQTVVVPNADVTVQEDTGYLQIVPRSASLADVVDALNRLGATPTDLMAILEALKAAGALNADLEII